MKAVKLSGILMDNCEFICAGKSIFLTFEEIEEYAEVVKDYDDE